jgi:hypothetical protein
MMISGATVKVIALLMFVHVSRMAGYAHSDAIQAEAVARV